MHDVPWEILRLKDNGLNSENPQQSETSNFALNVLETASAYQQKASEHRLGVGPPRTHSQSSGLNKYNPSNLSKAALVNAQKKALKDQVGLMDQKVGLKISATVWRADGDT